MDFTNRLAQASTNDPALFYRLLAQLGTDSAAEPLTNKLHINYVNQPVTPAVLAKIQAQYPNFSSISDTNLSPTNFVPWDLPLVPELSVQFFVTAAQRLFQEQFRQFNPGWDPNPALSVTNIPNITNILVTPTNYYTPALHRLLQVAANIFDATRTNIYPSVFRPQFTAGAVTNGVTNVFLTGFTNDASYSTLGPWLAANRQYGIPCVIGAKKGFPNFNEMTLQTDIQVTRKLQFIRPETNLPPNQTNQMYILGISNTFGDRGMELLCRVLSPPAPD